MNSEATQRFFREHREDDVHRLALTGRVPEGVDRVAALQMIASWQTARRKLPSWAACDGLLFPPHLAMEQCSSEPTARYKATLASRLVEGHGRLLADLTGGFGVDFSFMAPLFERAVYVERQEELCRLVRHNLPLLGVAHAEVVCGEAETFLPTLGQATLLFLDPARRDTHGRRTYALADCTPDVLQLREALLAHAERLMLKLSPMLDWRKAVGDMGRQYIEEVHLVGSADECKETLLIVNSREAEAPLRLVCAYPGREWTIEVDRHSLSDPLPPAPTAQPAVGQWLCEPHAAVMKAGCFGALAAAWGVSPLARDSHLFLADRQPEGFPGRVFRIERTASMNHRQAAAMLQGVDRANIATRNFPLTPDQLRRKLALADGGAHYLFATTLADGTRQLLLTAKA